ncbi:long-chain fatty acid--CoA ligase [Magnetospirillum sp. 64-120]|uniref:LuxE/PaaK family acyltransferase n=1 Tax=Magnetospirillum sp. 64-120 TaxID=1895778 RepID=UPI00092A58EA|nr:long-chain fatty acid--CoA ligase [Magnetospirillum sp. 64-120]OJX70370.1 MAG: acyl-protein synthetase [Magnetospirillum sp. 64-120]
MAELDDLLALDPFALSAADKAPLFAAAVGQLTRHHRDHCADYARILDVLGFDADRPHGIEDFPFLPARLFKLRRLQSVTDDQVHKVLTSSGTSGQVPSRIVLDAATAALQSRVLTRIVGDFIGKARLPMLVIDAPGTVKGHNAFSARAAGILGFSIFGRNPTYALNDRMELDWDNLDRFLAAHGGEPVLIFGFTFVIWQHFVQVLEKMGRRLNLDQAVLIHGGGWKKLAEQAVDDAGFKAGLVQVGGIRRIHDYYGMVEQTGSIFMQCAAGRLHCPVQADIVIRDAHLAPLPDGSRGLVQLVSLLPKSYPGHLLLSEDEGTVIGVDDCPCGRPGKTFTIHGRTAMAEIRGCSDAAGG